jgi:hypothetical protein
MGAQQNVIINEGICCQSTHYYLAFIIREHNTMTLAFEVRSSLLLCTVASMA